MAGYEVTFSDFQRLISDPYCQPSTIPLLRRWYGLEIVGTGDGAEVRAPGDRAVDLIGLHTAIQADGEKQRSLYNTAMTLWR